jgi:hypothetical protein
LFLGAPFHRKASHTGDKEEATLSKKSRNGWVPRLVILASIAVAFGLADMRQCFAACGGYCQARQTLASCHRAIKGQVLKANEREAEFEQCKADPASYLQLEELGTRSS